MSRTKRQFAAYARAGRPDEAEVLFEHSSDKYDYAGMYRDASGKWHLAALGFSRNSVVSRTRTACRKAGAWWSTADVFLNTSTAQAWEVTAPVVREYFGSHKVVITQGFLPGSGWVDLKIGEHGRKAGKGRIRALLREGYTALGFSQGSRVADFQADELVKSINLRPKAQA
jgi:hypothetical protein